LGLCFHFSFQSLIAPRNSNFNLSPVCGKSFESFCNSFVQENFCFQSERVYHCDITKGASSHAVNNQSDLSARSGFVCVLIGSVGSWKTYDSEAKNRGCKVIRFYKTVPQMKERSFDCCRCLPNPRSYLRDN